MLLWAHSICHFQILLRLRIVLPEDTHLRASILLCAVAASLKSLGQCAFANLTKRAAEDGFGSVHAATIAVDLLRQDGRMIQLGPKSGRLLPKNPVVILRGNVGIALLAIQPTDGNRLSHHLIPLQYLSKHTDSTAYYQIRR